MAVGRDESLVIVRRFRKGLRRMSAVTRVGWTIGIVTGALLAVLWTTTIDHLDYERREHELDAIRQITNLAMAYEVHTASTLQQVEHSMQFIVRLYRLQGRDVSKQDLQADMTMAKGVYTTLGITDRDGNIVLTDQGARAVNVADREYFQFHRAHPDPALHISVPVLGRLTGLPTIHISRRIDNADGTFGGVVLVGMDPRYFTEFYARTDLGPHALMGLARMDGIELVRRIGTMNSYGTDLRNTQLHDGMLATDHGEFAARGRFDGVPRFVSFRRVQHYPLAVTVGISQAEALASFYERRRLHLLIAALASALLVLVAISAVAAMRRQRLANISLANNERRLRESFDRAPNGIAHVDRHGRFLRANRKYCEILGYTENELRSMTALDVTHPDDRDALRASYDAVLADDSGASVPPVEKRNVRKDASVIWVNVAVSVVRGQRGRPDYLVTMMQDISRRKEAEARYRATFEQSAVAVFHIDLNGDITDCNRAFAHMFGFTRTEIVGMSTAALLLDADAEGVRDQRGLIATGVIDHSVTEVTYRRKDGSTGTLIRGLAPVRNASGGIEYFVGMAQDISGRKQAEAKLAANHAIATAVADATTLGDAVHSILRALCSTLGWSVGELWIASGDSHALCNAGTWHDGGEAGEHFAASNRTMTIARNVGWIGRIWASAAPAWLVDVAREPAFLRGEAAKAMGLRTAFAFPVRAQERVLGVIALYCREARQPDDALATMVATTGAQIGALLARKRDEQTIDDLRRQRELIVASVGDGIHGIDADGNIVFENPAAERLLGASVGALIGKAAHATMHHTRRDGSPYPVDACPIHATLHDGETRHVTDEVFWRADGTSFPVEYTATPMREEAGRVSGVVVAFRDVSRRVQAEHALRMSEERMRSILSSIDDVVWSMALPSLRFLYLSPATERIYARPCAAFLENPSLWHDVILAEDKPKIDRDPAACAQQGVLSLTYRISRPDGEIRWLDTRATIVRDETGTPVRLDGVTSDVTQRWQYQSRIQYLATHDPLTGLPNRNLVLDRIGQALLQARTTECGGAVVSVGIDRFSFVNESYGHQCGDGLLVAVARRLSSASSNADTVARVAGDEFIVLITGVTRNEDAVDAARRVLDAFQEPFAVHGRGIFATASVGVSVYPRDGSTADLLVRNANGAMHRAKQRGGCELQFYDEEISTSAQEHVELATDLRHALVQNQFELEYQPIADVEAGRIVGVEALVRWRHPRYGLLRPDRFIPLAEQTGLITALGEWVLRNACAATKRWHLAGHRDLRVAVNLSARQLEQPTFARDVQRVLAETGLEAEHLAFELTETILLHESDPVHETMKELRLIGIELSLDDFGTGYSSLNYLKRFPISTVKIDRAFVSGVTRHVDDAAIVKAIIAMANSLGMRTIAEGVETEGQLGFLRMNGCALVQGYLVSPPVAADAIGGLMQTTKLAPAAPADGMRRTLLLLDDEPNIIATLRRLLRREPYRILTATSASQAFELLAANEVAVIVSDQRMPEMTGVDFLRNVKALYPDTVRIVLSGYTELTSVTEAINEGAIYKFLTKPWDDEQLRDNIAEAFRRYDLVAENQRMARELHAANAELARMNDGLEKLVTEQSRRVEQEQQTLSVAQEALQRVPVGVIGIDEDGVIALANDMAHTLVGTGPTLLGEHVDDVLPVDFGRALAAAERESTVIVAGRALRLWREPMGESSCSRGSLLMLTEAREAA